MSKDDKETMLPIAKDPLFWIGIVVLIAMNLLIGQMMMDYHGYVGMQTVTWEQAQLIYVTSFLLTSPALFVFIAIMLTRNRRRQQK